MKTDHILLKQLTGQVIELNVRYQPIGNFTVFGRVRHVANGDTMWVGDANFAGETIVRVCPVADTMEYTVDLDVKEADASEPGSNGNEHRLLSMITPTEATATKMTDYDTMRYDKRTTQGTEAMNNYETFGRRVLDILMNDIGDDDILEIMEMAEKLGLATGVADGKFQVV